MPPSSVCIGIWRSHALTDTPITHATTCFEATPSPKPLVPLSGSRNEASPSPPARGRRAQAPARGKRWCGWRSARGGRREVHSGHAGAPQDRPGVPAVARGRCFDVRGVSINTAFTLGNPFHLLLLREQGCRKSLRAQRDVWEFSGGHIELRSTLTLSNSGCCLAVAEQRRTCLYELVITPKPARRTSSDSTREYCSQCHNHRNRVGAPKQHYPTIAAFC